MACIQTLAGLGQSCDVNLAGIKEVYLANIDDVSEVAVAEATHTVTALTMSGSAKFIGYKFAKQTGSFTSTLTKDEQNGSRYYTTELSLQFNKMEAKKHLEIEALAAGQLAAIVLDNNGKYWYVGYDNYLSATEATASAGQSFDDLNGYTTALSAMSGHLPFEIVDSAILTSVITEPID